MTTPVGTTDATRPNDIWPHTLLVGPLGIGKSHLLRHFATTLEQGSTEAREQGSENPKSEIRNPKFLYLEHRLRLKIEGSVASIAGRPLEIAFIVRSNGHLETNELLPAEDSITYEVEHYEIWAPADPTVLRILPGLAEEIGLNQSIVLLQLDYWIRHSDNVRDGRRWTYQSLRGMRKKAFKWWRKDTIRNPKSEIRNPIGFNASIVLLQLSYWIRHSDNVRDGKRWTFQSVRDMQHKAFKWWSLDTINRTIASLVAQHLIFATDEHNRHKYDRTRWFALNPHGFRKLKSIELKRLP